MVWRWPTLRGLVISHSFPDRQGGGKQDPTTKKVKRLSVDPFYPLDISVSLTWSKVLTSLHLKHARVPFTNCVGGSAAVSIADVMVDVRGNLCVAVDARTQP